MLKNIASRYPLIVALLLTNPSLIFAQHLSNAEHEDIQNLKAMSLEQLANIEVSIATKKPQSVESIPAAVFVITRDDIRRSTVNSIPELLRMVPGLNVARIDASHWAISARGGNGRFANKLLVLMDGRTVYTPLYSGVYWNVQDTMMEDIERIEVIRGPGASAWGSNAVNGVINIISRSAEDTHGTLASVALGDPESMNVGVRYGNASKENIAYRIYAKSRKNNKFNDSDEAKANDDWRDNRLGFHLDGLLSSNDNITLQGDIYRNEASQTSLYTDLLLGSHATKETFDDEGGNILARWSHNSSDSTQSILQMYYDYQKREEMHDKRQTFDIDFQYQLPIIGAHELSLGLGYNIVRDNIQGNNDRTYVMPEKLTHEIYSAFIQDQIRLNEHLYFTIGSKFEHNEYTGMEIQPSARLLWQPEEKQSIWLSISKASRIPSRIETSGQGGSEAIPASRNPFIPLPVLITGRSNPNQQSERLLAYEIGYRIQFGQQLSLDISGFYNDYSDLRTFEEGPLDFSNYPNYLEKYYDFDNLAEATTWGTEVSADWRLSDQIRLQLAYSFLQMDYNEVNGTTDTAVQTPEKQNPKHQLSLRFGYDPDYNWETDLWIRYVDDIKVATEKIPQYWTMDARIGWHINKNLDLSLVGQNLFNSSHAEFNEELNILKHTEIPRGFFIKAVWNY